MASASRGVSIGRLIAPMLLLGSMLTVAALYVNAQYPGLALEIKYKLSGEQAAPVINQSQEKEIQRLQKIDALLIPTRNKIDLREGRPFWTAAVHMVELAFGGPADEANILRYRNRLYEFHRYGFGGNREPVVLEFSDNSLTCVHFLKAGDIRCAPGVRSVYDGRESPFKYKISVGD